MGNKKEATERWNREKEYLPVQLFKNDCGLARKKEGWFSTTYEMCH